MIWIVAFLMAVPGFAALCLSMRKCQRQVFDTPVPKVRAKLYRWCGAFGLLASAILCLIAKTWSIGLGGFLGVWTFAALVTILTLALRPKILRYYFWVPGSKT